MPSVPICKQPAPGAVLALVAEEAPKTPALASLCEKHGQVLQFDVPKPANLHAWVRSEFERLGARADPDAARALVEICGEDVIALSSEIDKIISWAGGDAITRRDVEQLAVGGREAAAWALTDAWGARDLPSLLAACELALERKEPFLLAVGLATHVGRVRGAQALAEEGLRTKEIAARLKMKEYPARKALGHAEKYSRDELDTALVRLAELDAALKGASRLSAQLELERALVAITRPAGSVRGFRRLGANRRRRAVRPAPSCAQPHCGAWRHATWPGRSNAAVLDARPRCASCRLPRRPERGAS